MENTAPQKPRSVLILDLTRDGIACDESEVLTKSVDDLILHLRLALPNLHRAFRRDALKQLSDLSAFFPQSGPFPTVAIVGLLEDPFYPFEGKFHQALALIQWLASTPVERIVIQTRSPLAVLAMPVLKALGDRVTVRVAFEAISDVANKRYTPCLPNPSERVKLVRTLRSLGVATALQIAPMIEPGARLADRERFEAMIREDVSSISFIRFDKLVTYSGRDSITLHPKRSERYHALIQRSASYGKHLQSGLTAFKTEISEVDRRVTVQ